MLHYFHKIYNQCWLLTLLSMFEVTTLGRIFICHMWRKRAIWSRVISDQSLISKWQSCLTDPSELIFQPEVGVRHFLRGGPTGPGLYCIRKCLLVCLPVCLHVTIRLLYLAKIPKEVCHLDTLGPAFVTQTIICLKGPLRCVLALHYHCNGAIPQIKRAFSILLKLYLQTCHVLMQFIIL